MERIFEYGFSHGDGFKRNKFYRSETKQQLIKDSQGLEDSYVTTWDYDVFNLAEVNMNPGGFDFNALPKYGDFYADFDCEHLAVSEVDAEEFVRHLIEMGVSPGHISLYFSGAKGYHVIVPEEYFQISDRKNLHKFYHAFAKYMVEKYDHAYMDLKVYDSRRLFRIEGSINSKSGLPKKLVSGPSKVYPDERKTIRPLFFQHVFVKDEPVREPKVSSTEKLDLEPFAKRMLDASPPPGERNNTAYTLALYLKDKGYTEEEAFDILLGSKNTVDATELLTLVRSAYKGDKHFGLRNNDLVEKYMLEHEKIEYDVTPIEDEMLVRWDKVIGDTKEHLKRFDPKSLLTYGIDNIDNYLGKIQPSELVVVGGTSGIGKSEFVWNIAKANAKMGIPVGFIGLEMSPEQYAMRTIRNKSGIDIHTFKTQDMTETQRSQLNAAMDDLQNDTMPMYFFNPKFGIDVTKLERLVKGATAKYGIKLWVIDHLHYFPSSSEDAGGDIAYIVTAIKQLTLAYNIPIVLVSHYRKIQAGFRPTLNSFKDTIVIPQVADTVIGLDRDQTTDNLEVQRTVSVNVLKSRYGMPTATLKIKFDPQGGKYESMPDFMYGFGDGLTD